MNWDTIKGNWKQLMGEAKSHWGQLTDDDVQEAAGEREKLVGKVQVRYVLARDEAKRQVDEFVAKY
jgi:uncharacterized protein YjbJ (UPF0337 family)